MASQPLIATALATGDIGPLQAQLRLQGCGALTPPRASVLLGAVLASDAPEANVVAVLRALREEGAVVAPVGLCGDESLTALRRLHTAGLLLGTDAATLRTALLGAGAADDSARMAWLIKTLGGMSTLEALATMRGTASVTCTVARVLKAAVCTPVLLRDVDDVLAGLPRAFVARRRSLLVALGWPQRTKQAHMQMPSHRLARRQARTLMQKQLHVRTPLLAQVRALAQAQTQTQPHKKKRGQRLPRQEHVGVKAAAKER